MGNEITFHQADECGWSSVGGLGTRVGSARQAADPDTSILKHAARAMQTARI